MIYVVVCALVFFMAWGVQAYVDAFRWQRSLKEAVYGEVEAKREADESVRLHRELLEAFDAEIGGKPLMLDDPNAPGGKKLVKYTPRKPAVLGEARLSLPAYTPLQTAMGYRDINTRDFGMTDREWFEQTHRDMRNQIAGIGAGMQNAAAAQQWFGR